MLHDIDKVQSCHTCVNEVLFSLPELGFSHTDCGFDIFLPGRLRDVQMIGVCRIQIGKWGTGSISLLHEFIVSPTAKEHVHSLSVQAEERCGSVCCQPLTP